MTTSQGTSKPAEGPAAGAGAAPGSELSRRDTDADAQETAPLTGRVAPAPDNRQQLEAEIERTREQLGETVQELVARADVKSRARAKATEFAGRVRSTTVQARGQVADKTAAARQKATSTRGAGKDQLRNRAAAVGAPVWEATPDQVRRAVTKGASGARERWVPLAATAGVLLLGYLALRKWNGRSSSAAQIGPTEIAGHDHVEGCATSGLTTTRHNQAKAAA
jgi:hypothetical protein